MINANIQLLDDSINGDKIYQINNIQMINLQRSSKRIKDYQNSSLYILLGPNYLRRQIYIGQTTNICRRLKQHQRAKDFWTETIFFKGDRELTKTETEWLESQMIQLFINNNQFDLIKNYCIPTNIVINEKDVPELNEILKIYKLLINVFYGFRMILNDQEYKEDNTSSNSIINRIVKMYKSIPDYEETYEEDETIHFKDAQYLINSDGSVMILEGSYLYGDIDNYKEKMEGNRLLTYIFVESEEQAKLIIG